MRALKALGAALRGKRKEAPRSLTNTRVERLETLPVDLGIEGLRQTITRLDACAGKIGCVVFHDGRPTDRVVVIFAGQLERFHMLSVTRSLGCPVICFQDVESGWYEGSSILPALPDLCAGFLREEIGAAVPIFFGQSSGAYAALVASASFPGSSAVACSPQTFSDAAAKARIRFVGIRVLTAPAGLVDVATLLRSRADPRSFRAVVIPAGETANPWRAHYWMDYIHFLRLTEVPGIAAFVVDAENHALVHGRAEAFAGLLARLVAEAMAPRERREAIFADALEDIFGASR